MTKKRLINYLPPNIIPNNPVDTVLLDNEGYAKCADIVLDDPNTTHILMILSSLAHNLKRLGVDFADLGKKATSLNKTISISFLSPSDYLTDENRKVLEDNSILVYEGNPIRALRAIKHMNESNGYRRSLGNGGAGSEYFVERRPIEKKVERKDVGEIIAKYHLSVPLGVVTESNNQAKREAEKIGYPVVLKALSPRLQHKTEYGLVQLNLNSADEVEKAYEQIMDNIKKYHSEEQLTGIIVEEMVKGGVECIFGISQSPEFGSILMFGTGGIMTELTKDVSYRAFPLRDGDIKQMITETKVYELLKGFRGDKRKDIEKLLLEIQKIIRMFEKEKWIKELEVNPILVLDKGKGVVLPDILVIPGH
jgi:acyl-CoA synthetase (NDP forming)